MTRDDDVCNSLSSTKASQCRFWERVPFPISFKDTLHGEKSASSAFLFFSKNSVYVSPLSSSLRLVSSSTKEETSKGPPLLVGFFCANTKNDTAKERESSSRWLRCETKKVGVPFDESPLPFASLFPDHLFRSIDKTFFWAAQNVPLNPLMRKSKKREREGHCSR